MVYPYTAAVIKSELSIYLYGIISKMYYEVTKQGTE